MANDSRFKQATIDVLAKRAAYLCSNPDCGAITSGPTLDIKGTTNVGEAAHIYGANPGSARFESAMSPAERSSISNGIWLCTICHKLVDDDPLKFPAGLLFEWQRTHEGQIAQQVGRTSALARERYERRHLEGLGRLSYVAERIVLQKDDFWEYRLTAEVLRCELAPVLHRWSALRRGMYVRPYVLIKRSELLSWVLARTHEASALGGAVGAIVNEEFSRAWGARGVAGNDTTIIQTCRLLAEVCNSALIWEESVRFAYSVEESAGIFELLCGACGRIIDESSNLPAFLSEIFGTEKPSGSHRFVLTLDLPEGWVEKLADATRKISAID
jgi:hypothetical protein